MTEPDEHLRAAREWLRDNWRASKEGRAPNDEDVASLAAMLRFREADLRIETAGMREGSAIARRWHDANVAELAALRAKLDAAEKDRAGAEYDAGLERAEADIQRERADAAEARAARLTEVLSRLRECFDNGEEYDGHAMVPVEAFTERVSAADKALAEESK